MESTFAKECALYVDQDGLIGSEPNPTKWSSGNALLETAIACVIETLLNQRNADVDFLSQRQAAIARCQNPDGSFDKNPGRPDQITHDDMKAVAAVSRVCGMPFARTIAAFGSTHAWVLSNTGFPYWDACVKPWDKPVYLMCAGRAPSWFETLMLCPAILADGWRGDASSNRLTWLCTTAIKGMNPLVDASIWAWNRNMRTRYVTVGDLMMAYYLRPDHSNLTQVIAHPFVAFGRMIKF